MKLTGLTRSSGYVSFPAGLEDDPGDFSCRVIDPSSNLAATGLQGPCLSVTGIAQAVAQSAGASAQQLGQLCLREQQSKAFGQLML